MTKLKDVDVVRWAYVRVLIASPEYHELESDVFKEERDQLVESLYSELVSASLERLLWLLHIEDLDLAKRVQRAVRANEASRESV